MSSIRANLRSAGLTARVCGCSCSSAATLSRAPVEIVAYGAVAAGPKRGSRRAGEESATVSWADVSPVQAFVEADADGSGQLTLEELREALRAQSKLSEDAIDALFVASDVGGDGTLSLLDFVRGCRAVGPPPPPATLDAGWVWAPVDAFIEIDKDLSGKLSLEELRLALREKSGMSEESVQELFVACDTSGDGSVTIYEFVRGIKAANSALYA